jgi:HlyD family secretion protein
MHHRNIIIGVVVLAVLVMAGLFFIGRDTAETAAFKLEKITRGQITAYVSATGSLSPVITVQVGSQVSGAIQHLNADFNSRVKKGDVIAQIDPAIFKARLAEAEANLKNAEAARDKARVSMLDAKRQLGRQEEVYKQELISESELDAARLAHDAAVVELRVKEASVAQAKATRDREKVNLAYTTIYAPIDGVVISRDVDVGQTVAASLQAPTLFTIAQDLTHMQIETEVDEAFIGQIKQGQAVRFTVFAYPQRIFKGSLAQVRLQPKVEAGVVKYNCIIHVDNSDMALKPGMTATVNIQVAQRKDVLKVPNASLRYVPDWPPERLKGLRDQLSNNEAIIWTSDGDGIKPITVSLGLVGERETEVSAAALQEGMPVVMPATASETSRKRRFGLRLF